jgi:hypothetical protein
MADQRPAPGKIQAMVDALRGYAGMGPQQTPGPAMDTMGQFRATNMERMQQGQEQLTPEQYLQMLRQQQGGM